MNDRVIAWWTVPTHILAVSLVQATMMASLMMMPVLARKRFGASDWQTLLLSATPTAFFALSIFWNDLFRRRTFGRYLLLFWVVGSLPYALCATADSYWMLLVPHLIACVGGAGYHPAAGEMLKSLYPDRVRGRVYAWVWGGSTVAGAAVSYGLGQWLRHDQDAFKVYLPLGAGLQGVGLLVLYWLAHKSGHLVGRLHDSVEDTRSRVKRLIEPVLHMRQALRADPVFTRYEAAYMTYGVGWMVGHALLPLFVTEKLNLNYDVISKSAYSAYLLALVPMIPVFGMIIDRVGPIRCAALSFALLTLYPVGLVLSDGPLSLLLASVWFGLAHGGASMAWVLGPVSLAPTPAKVPQYVAIHATLVGVRGTLFQFLGVFMLWATGGFTIPLLMAAAAYVWASYQMLRLGKLVDQRRRSAKAAGDAPLPSAS